MLERCVGLAAPSWLTPPEELDVRAYVADLKRRDEERLHTRIDRVVHEGELAGGAGPAVLAGLVQTRTYGLSVRTETHRPGRLV